MSNKHVGRELVEQYVIGALDPESARYVEAHVAQCGDCARLLQEEARVEVALHEVAAQRNVVSLSSRRRRLGVVISAVAAVAATVLILVVRFGGSSDSPPSLRECNDPATAAACLSQAQFDGVITLDPRGQPVVPRYDVGGAP